MFVLLMNAFPHVCGFGDFLGGGRGRGVFKKPPKLEIFVRIVSIRRASSFGHSGAWVRADSG